MCLIAFAIDAAPGLPLVLASNRDEDFDRPTQPLQAWPLASGRTVWSGRDLRAGGTWLGIAQGGRVAMLTNVREAATDEAPASRGELVTGWLDSDLDWQDWMAPLDPARYAGFNLVLGDLAAGRWVGLSNRSDRTAERSRGLPPGWHGGPLTPGVYGLSNAALDTPWPKTLALKQALQHHLDSGARPDDLAALLDALLQRRAADVAQLPATGLPQEVELALSSPFVRLPGRRYGTRSSAIVHAQADGKLSITEWTHVARDQAADGAWSATDSVCRAIESHWSSLDHGMKQTGT